MDTMLYGYCVFQFYDFHLALGGRWVGGSRWERQFTGDPAGCHLGHALQRLLPVQGPAGTSPLRTDAAEAATRPLAVAELLLPWPASRSGLQPPLVPVPGTWKPEEKPRGHPTAVPLVWCPWSACPLLSSSDPFPIVC